MTVGAGPIRKRHVFFLHGFDPRGPAAYHSMYSREAAKQAALDGATVSVSKRENDGPRASAWNVEASHDGQQTETRYEFLRWDDIVRRHWPKRKWPLLVLMIGYLLAFREARFLGMLRRSARPAYLAIFFPPMLVGAFILAGLLLAGGAAFLAVSLGAPWWGSLLSFFAVCAAWVFAWDRLETAWNPCWLARVFGFLVAWAKDRIDGLDERHRFFAERLAAGLDDPSPDEILIVGHSIGAQHAISALNRLEEMRPGSLADPRLKLLTLGQCIPLLARLLGAKAFREDLGRLIVDHPLVWVDVTSPADPASSCAIDPLAATDRMRSEGQPVHPIQVSPRFHLLMPKEAFQKVRRDPLLFHFQYLMAQEIAGPYNFFRLTAGPRPLSPPSDRIGWSLNAGEADPP